MKTTLLLPFLIPATYAWTFTWRNADGDEHTERGRGPSDCIKVNHAKGELFVLDGQGEKNINMLLFTNDECSGEPAGSASESFTRESSVAIKGFQVVPLDGGDDDTTTSTRTTGSSTSPTGSSTPTPTHSPTSTPSSTSTETETGTDVTLTETATATATQTNEPGETETPEPQNPDDAALRLLISRNDLVGVAMGVVAGGYALDWLF
ncbi:uncharacterized protein BJX67DRAFT_310451 [Aspergillus lucknowensis]|uniref:Uncharacterized protein n=1 Tax=Aspergillus lucknowensis TaxID=176173 RepID=A0ABR4LCP4_9EURO